MGANLLHLERLSTNMTNNCVSLGNIFISLISYTFDLPMCVDIFFAMNFESGRGAMKLLRDKETDKRVKVSGNQ